MLFKKNVWLVFYAILFFSLIALFTMTYTKKKGLETESALENKSIALLLTQSFKSTLVENELLLDVLGSRLLENNLYQNPEKTHDLLKKMLISKSSLAGFGLLNLKGNYLAVSGNMDVTKAPSLLNLPESKDSFLKTLKSKRMVIGRTYYFSPLKTWVIPLRKALINAKGEVVAVMATGIRLDNGSFLESADFKGKKRAVFINTANMYRIYASGLQPSGYQAMYSKPVNGELIHYAEHYLLKHYGVTREEIENTTQTRSFSMVGYSELLQQTTNSIGVYEPTYHIWMFLLEPKTLLNAKLRETFFHYLLIFLVTNFIIFWLFWIIASYETKTREKLVYQASHDALTGLFNRNYLENKTIFDQLQAQKNLKVLFIDLDNFKNLNDSFGHEIGDKILILVAKRLQALIPETQKIIRFGGDEFVAFLSGTTEEHNLALAIIERLSQSYLIDEMKFSLGASIGISVRSELQESIETLISQADMAMYIAKQRKNSLEYFSEQLGQKLARKIQIEQHLRSALVNQEMYIVYQPQLTQTGALHGVESLVRWQNPILGSVHPVEFIPIAEDIGLMPELGKFITEHALSEICALQQKIGHVFKVSINVSVKQFLEQDFISSFQTLVNQCHIDTFNLTLEVTESVFIEEIHTLLPKLKELKSMGIWISLDDFGTGYSSLNLLRKLPLDELKIDKSFVDHIHEDEKDRGLITSIINIAQNIGVHTLAEGVENAEQHQILLSLGCEFFQGYLFSKPLRVSDLEIYIQKNFS